MIEREDENSNTSSDDSSSSFSSVSKSRKQVSKNHIKQSGSKIISNKATASSVHNSLNTPTLSNLEKNSPQALLYNNSQANSLFKLTSNNLNSQAIKNVANYLASANPNNSLASSSNPSTSMTALNQQAYFQNSLSSSASDLYKMPTAGGLHMLNAVNNKETGNSSKNQDEITSQLEDNNRNRERMINNCSSSSNSSNASFNNESNNNTGEVIVVAETVRKREIRLLKNREAARECRRKKKEYIKCLENRVAVLENQNKTLIDELKALKELYCQNGDPTHK